MRTKNWKLGLFWPGVWVCVSISGVNTPVIQNHYSKGRKGLASITLLAVRSYTLYAVITLKKSFLNWLLTEWWDLLDLIYIHIIFHNSRDVGESDQSLSNSRISLDTTWSGGFWYSDWQCSVLVLVHVSVWSSLSVHSQWILKTTQ